jgi:hypothetical protein
MVCAVLLFQLEKKGGNNSQSHSFREREPEVSGWLISARDFLGSFNYLFFLGEGERAIPVWS